MQNIQDELTIPERLAAPTPKIFKVIRAIGLILTAVAGTLLTLQEEGYTLPSALAIIANYATVAAGIATTIVSSLTVDVEKTKKAFSLEDFN